MKVGDLVKTTRYGTHYLIFGKREDLSSTNGGQVFKIISVDGRCKQVLRETHLEVVSEGR
jgi:hypothetical protein